MGGYATNPSWTAQTSTEAFAGALIASLVKQDLYSSGGRYKLDVQFLNIDWPLYAPNVTRETSIEYTLKDRETNKVIFRDVVVANHTATFSDAFTVIPLGHSVKRIRLANDGSARNNIGLLLEELSKLQIEDGKISIK